MFYVVVLLRSLVFILIICLFYCFAFSPENDSYRVNLPGYYQRQIRPAPAIANNQTNLKIQREGFFYCALGGVDFYLQCFNLGFELKPFTGNLIKKENSIFTNNTDGIRDFIYES